MNIILLMLLSFSYFVYLLVTSCRVHSLPVDLCVVITSNTCGEVDMCTIWVSWDVVVSRSVRICVCLTHSRLSLAAVFKFVIFSLSLSLSLMH